MKQRYKENYFKFKRFGLFHGLESFKISTDAVVLGAWAAQKKKPVQILDIGTGSGIIALMLAQRFMSAKIDAVEINFDAVQIAQTNFEQSPYKDRLNIIHEDIRSCQLNYSYDLIATNPPFFNASLLPENETNKRSKHNISLVTADIFRFAAQYLKESGTVSIIFPFEQYEKLIEEAKSFGFCMSKTLFIHPNPQMPIRRCILEFSKINNPHPDVNHLFIENEKRHDFHQSYVELCKDFYLNF